MATKMALFDQMTMRQCIITFYNDFSVYLQILVYKYSILFISKFQNGCQVNEHSKWRPKLGIFYPKYDILTLDMW